MAQPDKTTDVVFSAKSQVLIPRIRLIDEAQKNLWEDYRKILDAVAEQFPSAGFVARVHIDPQGPWGILQLAMPHWPKPYWSGVHFEVNLDRQWILRDRVSIGLDVEDSVPRKHAVIACLSRLLESYENSGLLVQSGNVAVVPNSVWRVFEGTLPLTTLSSRQLCDVLRPLSTLAPLVDEALFVGDGHCLWRTDFLERDPQPTLSWGGMVGGQRMQGKCGLMASPSLLVDGRMAGNHDAADGRPTHIATLTFTQKIDRGDKIYLSCVLRTTQGGRLWFLGDVLPKQGGVAALFESPHWLEIPVPGKPDWQHVGFTAQVRTPDDCEFRETGATIFLRTQTEDPEFLINSIEFGRCGGG